MYTWYTFYLKKHGRVKVRTTAEQEEIKKRERAKKVEVYKAGINAVFDKRKKDVKDESGLEVSAKLLSGNPDIYTLWNIRREILLHLKLVRSDNELNQLLEEELQLTEMCLRTQPKSYGTWHHRCWVLDQMKNPPWKKELALCDKYLNYDERNFHCWDYRRFVVERSGVTAEEELKFTDEKIATNFSNYSAWHLRSNILPQVHPDPEGTKPIHEEQHKQELELVTNAAFTDPYDQSAWFYQRWLLGRQTAELRITQVVASQQLVCVAFNQSISPQASDISVTAPGGDQSWQTVDGETSSFVWKKKVCLVPGAVVTPVELMVGGEKKQSVSLRVDGVEAHQLARYTETPEFQAGFSPGVTQVLCSVLESCQTLLELEPDIKWPLLTSVLLMQSIDRNKFKNKSLEYLDLLAKIDKLRANYYSDLRSRYVMECFLEQWRLDSDYSLAGAGLTALYHAQYLLPLTSVDLSGNSLARSLPRLSSLQFCQVLNLDENNLKNLKGFPSLPLLVTLSLKNNQLCLPEDIELYIKASSGLKNIYIDGNPLSSTHHFCNGSFVNKNEL